jgi:[acyl-carrier-protein] S-malonyltransferase
MFFLMFTGQGSQQPKMGKDFYDLFEVAKNVMSECNDALGYDLSKIIFDENPAELNKTINTQPAILANAIMIYKSITSVKPEFEKNISYMAGHSVGEYCALCADGIFSVDVGAKLLKARAQFMEEACPSGSGGMAALLKVTPEKVMSVISDAILSGEICEMANDNGAEQIVISGSSSGIEIACKIAKEHGIKAIKLNVSGPFHSSLMSKAADNMALELAKHKFELASNTKVISNVTADLFDLSEETIKNNLTKQIVSPVRWRETILNAFHNQKITKFIEIGPKPVLTNLLKNTLPQDQISYEFIGSVVDLEKINL